jgi:hypothetical protein
MQPQHRLDDILARDIAIQWFESIALVQAVCEQVLAQGSSDGFPSAAEIGVDADGSIAVLGLTAGPAVASAGHLLAGMVGADVPVRLRLAINEATATESPYRHLAAFSEALAYFERPGRRELIATVYARAAAAPLRHIARPMQTPEPEALPDRQKQTSRPPQWRRALVPLLLIAGGVVAASIWLVSSHRQVSAALSALVETHSAQKLAPTEPIRVPDAQPHRRATPVKAPMRREMQGPKHETARSVSVPAKKQDAPPRMVFYDLLEIPATAPGDAADVSVSDIRPRVYSHDDGFVSPPRPVRPQLPPEPPFDPTVAPPTEIELVIGTTGLVESAKLRSVPRNITEFMLLSAAKAWIFQPAVLEGRPVTYRYRVRLILP